MKPKRAERGNTFAAAEWRKLDPCAYCGDASDVWDHIEPRKRLGRNTQDNAARACRKCNGKKAAKPLLVFLAERITTLI